MLMEGFVGLAGGILGAVASWLAIARSLRAPVDALKEKVSRLEQEKLRKLELQIEQHLGGDQSQRMLAMLEGIQAEIAKMNAKIDKLCEESARQGAQIAANDRYLQNLDASFERHKQEHKGG